MLEVETGSQCREAKKVALRDQVTTVGVGAAPGILLVPGIVLMARICLDTAHNWHLFASTVILHTFHQGLRGS